MRKNRSVVAMTVLLCSCILAIIFCREASAEFNAAKGFRHIKWGTKIASLKQTMVDHSGTACGEFYYIKNDVLTIFNIPVGFIRYEFRNEFRGGEFFAVAIDLNLKDRYGTRHYDKKLANSLLENLTKQYGKPDTRSDPPDDRYGSVDYTWKISDVKITLSLQQHVLNGHLNYTYEPIAAQCRTGVTAPPKRR